jgi:drug/metabolite transporter (DMT)-like permease
VTGLALGLIVAIAFGSGDFAGGRASARASTVAVLAVAQAVSVLGALVLVVFVGGHASNRDLLYGALAGAVNVVGLGLLYDALARHTAVVVAPVTALVASIVPVTWGFAHGERPSALVAVGAALAVAAGVLISREPSDTPTRGIAPGALQAVVAGAALGSSLVLFSETAHTSGQWPVLMARIAALVVVLPAVALLFTRRQLKLPRGQAAGLSAIAGALDVAATAVLVVAVRRALLVVVAPLAALAPGFTVLLAWLVTRQNVGRSQRLGLVVALAGLALIAAG